MRGIDLFAGSGIGSLALKHIIPGYETACYVENEIYCQAILISRIKDGLLDDAPIWGDVRTFDGKQWRGKVDIVYGGFPCQPFSVAGKNKGAEDERNMWPDTARIISEVRPRYALLENTPNILVHKYIRRVFGDLAEIGYDCEWDIVSAGYVGAIHRRPRLWIFAYANSIRIQRQGNGQITQPVRQRWPIGQAIEQYWTKETIIDGGRGCICEPALCRANDGLAAPMDRLKMLGNGWVIQVLAKIIQVSNRGMD